MPAFRYKHGEKPLEGYTIQHAAGRGGFGEVYYALSDSGREVALKAVQGYEAIELRGVSQCMNLKSANLVTIFDVRHNDENVPFVIMEYVSGPSLRQLLDESPGGLGTQKAAFFLREMGKGLQYLHDCGVVHRDLKPGNVFYENGTVKIGDYGLSKAISESQHSGQTITVGTVHYMAPEIGKGKYDKSIDIYALGAVLYEMLTGRPPFIGGSPAEILMRHLSDDPDCAGIEEPFASVIRKAMARDPEKRYQSVQEMVEAVFGVRHVQESMSGFSPESLSMVAARAAQRVAAGSGSRTPPPIPLGAVPLLDEPHGSWHPGSPRALPYGTSTRELQPVIRYLWLGGACLCLPLAIVLFAVASDSRGDEFVISCSVGLSGLFLAGVCVWRVISHRWTDHWRYLIRPGVFLLLVQTFFASAISLGELNLRGEEFAIAIFFLMFSIAATIGLIIATVLMRKPRGFYAPAPVPLPPAPPPPPAPPLSHHDPELTLPMASSRLPASSYASMQPEELVVVRRTLLQRIFGLFGWVILIAGTLLGLAMAAHVPGIINASHGDFYSQNPPAGVMRLTGAVVAWALLLAALGLFFAARRGLGIFHLARAAFGVLALGGACFIVYAAFEDRGGLSAAARGAFRHPEAPRVRYDEPRFQRTSGEQAVQDYLDNVSVGMLVPAGLVMSLGVVSLLWPARQPVRKTIAQPSVEPSSERVAQAIRN